MMNKRLCLAVVGPTASGKSELAVKLAKKYNGEIISADSRQIYKGMNIGSGKVEGKWKRGVFVYKDIPHDLIDEADPKIQYSVERFQRNATAVIKKIHGKGKLPIICGGTGLWVDALVFDHQFPKVKPNAKLRKKLEEKTLAELYSELKKLDPARAKSIDRKNPHRLIRALEIVLTTGKPVPVASISSPYEMLWIGLNPGSEVLEKKIAARLKKRMSSGMISEVKKLSKKLSWKKLESFGLEYKFCALHLQGKISKTEAQKLLNIAIRQYAKRQMTWWKRNGEIKWFPDEKSALNCVQDFFRSELNK